MVIFLDMDGVLANIHKEIGFYTTTNQTPPEVLKKDLYLRLGVARGAREFIDWCLEHDEINLYVATKIPKENPSAATEKLLWIERYFPELKNKVFVTPDKTLLKGDFLIDDDLRWEEFSGTFLHFDYRNPQTAWKKIKIEISRKLKNSQNLKLVYNPFDGVRIFNNTNTLIRELYLSESFGPFYDIPPEKDVLVFEPQIPEYGWTVTVAKVEWADGKILKNIKLTT